MKYNKNAIIEAVGGLKILLHDFEKKATPRVQFKAMRHALATAIKCCEKQIPKKIEVWNGQASCPCCKKLFGSMETVKKLVHWEMPYCKYCGQALDWKVE